jgi:hypothetical protein
MKTQLWKMNPDELKEYTGMAETAANPQERLHHDTVDTAKQGRLPTRQHHSRRQPERVLGDGRQTDTSDRQERATTPRETSTRDKTLTVPTSTGGETPRVSQHRDEPRTTTGPIGTGVADQA